MVSVMFWSHLPSAEGLEVTPGWSGVEQKISSSSGIEFRTVQTLEIRCTDYVFPTHGRIYLEKLGVGGST